MIKIASWNTRGLNQIHKQNEVIKLIDSNSINVCAILETKVKYNLLEKITKRVFGRWKWASNNAVCRGRTRIILGWNDNLVNVEVINQSDQVVHCKVVTIDGRKDVYCSFIYASNDESERRLLWRSLCFHKAFINNKAWIIMGDFNVSLDPGDKSNGSTAVSSAMADFRECIEELDMEDINHTGLRFTWIQKPLATGPNRGILKKLDRVMGNGKFVEQFPRGHVVFMPYNISDHSPAILHLPDVLKRKPCPFKFNNHLVSKKEFIPLVRKAWDQNVPGCTMYSVVTKLKRLKKEIRKLNSSCGDVHSNVNRLREEVAKAQIVLDVDPDNEDLRCNQAYLLREFKFAIRDEEVFLRQKAKIHWLKEGDHNSAYFHNVVKWRVNRNRIEAIEDMQGQRFIGSEVSDQFVKHFESILGCIVGVDNISNPETLFTKKLNSTQADYMVRDISDSEVKEAMFDIEDTKAPGPDGFSSKFFKSAWPVVGEEVCQAVKEFFHNGKLLKEISATVLALVPKIPSPKNVADYRPIACCNVIYKCISKILVNRVKDSLDILVNENQSAFIPNRQISDNILLAQEIMQNYHKEAGIKRCAFKIDIQKAYDTVSWDFLHEILKRFGFHPCMVHWIMMCVSTTSYTLNINGEHQGFFRGMRGLRQGDPLSPYLFTLVMEILTLIVKRKVFNSENFQYHPKCKELGITHLCFADDLLMFCKGDIVSIQVLMDALREFSGVSGLNPSMEKSTVYMGNITGDEKQVLLNLVPFKVGSLPVKYLGVPLISTRLYPKDCKGIIDRVQKRLMDWKNKNLSFAGKLQLVQSVISSIQVYWSSMFILPSSVHKEVERLMRGFLWCNGPMKKGKAKVSWNELCFPKDQGGLGIKSLKMWNKALISKHIWNIIVNKQDSLWVRWIHMYKLKGISFWEVKEGSNPTWSWRKLLSLRSCLRNHILHEIGNGEDTSMWFDTWLDIGPLSEIVTKRDIYETRLGLKCKVADVFKEGSWIWPHGWSDKFGVIVNSNLPVVKDGVRDKVKWKMRDGKKDEFSVAKVWQSLRQEKEKVSWAKVVWFSQNIPRHSFILWLAVKERLLTQDRMGMWCNDDELKCSLCKQARDSHSHLFLNCNYSKEVWENVKEKGRLDNIVTNLQNSVNNWQDVISLMSSRPLNKSIWSIIQRLLFSAVVYFIWQERNYRQFQEKERSVEILANHIIETVKMRLMGLKVKNSSQVKQAAKIWNINLRLVDKDNHDDV